MVSEAPVLNVAAYKFVRLKDLQSMRDAIRRHCLALGVRGTVLLAPEGINLFLAGDDDAIDGALSFIRQFPGLDDLQGKFSRSAQVPFRRMLVRLKKEIIPFGVPDIRPDERTSPKLPPRELKRWLDEGRRVRLLDVRNEYEVQLGTFAGAEHLQLHHFRDFLQAAEKLPPEARDEPIVMFCTGGIRCEKAGPLLEKAGFRHVYQLEGGILKYFEECGGAHYQGSCFVFDGRVALDPALRPTGNLLCFACQAVLTAEDVTSGKFLFGQYCPKCYRDPQQVKESQFELHRRLIGEVAERQPGCTPYEHVRPIYVPRRFAGLPLLDFLCQRFPGVSRNQWEAAIEQGNLTHNKFGPTPFRVCTADEIIREGQGFLHRMPDTIEPAINPKIDLIYEDEWLLAVDKPAPLPVHPSGRYQRNTLTWLLGQVYEHEVLHLVHRVDANTTGVVLLTRRHRAAKLLAQQFARGTVEKIYYALLHGHPKWDRHEESSSIAASPTGEAGRRTDAEHGRLAVTKFEVVRRLPEGMTLVKVEPLTGRTNQIRVHAWKLGHPVSGDPLYLPAGRLGDRQTLDVADAPMCLHAHRLTINHPIDGNRLTLRSTPPTWLASILPHGA
ncbi:MAG: hypothetical protein KatS3mg111_0374 [Pirellulaceae bacterium]|nr:MAG: hypothetical protein KatS3mg111_0374 [Pirellulaceae bacterium]